MMKIVGQLVMAHEVDYRGAIENAIEAYVRKAVENLLEDWTPTAAEDRPAIEFFSTLEGDDAGVEFDLQDFVDTQVDIYEDTVTGGDSAREAAKVWYDFFVQSAVRMTPFLDPEDM